LITMAKKILTHIVAEGKARMVDVSEKSPTARRAVAESYIRLSRPTMALLRKGKLPKGNAIETARLAGIMAAKRTAELIPMCHAVALSHIAVTLRVCENGVSIATKVKTTAETGVEMEALTAVSVALLTVWDMTKQYEKDAAGQYPSTAIENIHVVRKFKQA